MAEVAHSVGYTNVHQFYTVFQRYYSLLPAEYRRYYTPAGVGDLSLEPAGAVLASPDTGSWPRWKAPVSQ